MIHNDNTCDAYKIEKNKFLYHTLFLILNSETLGQLGILTEQRAMIHNDNTCDVMLIKLKKNKCHRALFLILNSDWFSVSCFIFNIK